MRTGCVGESNKVGIPGVGEGSHRVGAGAMRMPSRGAAASTGEFAVSRFELAHALHRDSVAAEPQRARRTAFGRIVLHQILCRRDAVDALLPDGPLQIRLKMAAALGSANSTTVWSCGSTTSPTGLSARRIKTGFRAGNSCSCRCSPGMCHILPTKLRPSRIRTRSAVKPTRASPMVSACAWVDTNTSSENAIGDRQSARMVHPGPMRG
jgi:hypothetical protein